VARTVNSVTVNSTLDYDPAGRLSKFAVTGGATTKFLYDGAEAIAEYDGANALLRKYVPGAGVDETLVWYEGSGTSTPKWLITDPRGSVIGVADSTGAVTNKNKYDDYGAPAAGNVGRFQFTGQMWLAEAGLYHYKARAYHPELGRFLQTDPIGYGDGMNLYAYAGNDPVNGTDPTGLKRLNNGDFKNLLKKIDGGPGGGFGASLPWLGGCAGPGYCNRYLRTDRGGSNGAALFFGQSSGAGQNPNRPEIQGGGGGGDRTTGPISDSKNDKTCDQQCQARRVVGQCAVDTLGAATKGLILGFGSTLIAGFVLTKGAGGVIILEVAAVAAVGAALYEGGSAAFSSEACRAAVTPS
jgi:RHS repeat-associated protein